MIDEVVSDSYRYLDSFDYHIVLTLGPSYDPKFKEVVAWCNAHFGVKFKDWFMMGRDKRTYILHVRDNKWLTIFNLTFADIIDHNYKI
jgi:hypothetical protein